MGKTNLENGRKRQKKLQHTNNGLNPGKFTDGSNILDIKLSLAPKPGEQPNSVRTVN